MTFLKRETGKNETRRMPAKKKKHVIVKTNTETELGIWSVLLRYRVSQSNKPVDKKINFIEILWPISERTGISTCCKH